MPSVERRRRGTLKCQVGSGRAAGEGGGFRVLDGRTGGSVSRESLGGRQDGARETSRSTLRRTPVEPFGEAVFDLSTLQGHRGEHHIEERRRASKRLLSVGPWRPEWWCRRTRKAPEWSRALLEEMRGSAGQCEERTLTSHAPSRGGMLQTASTEADPERGSRIQEGRHVPHQNSPPKHAQGP